MKKFIVRLVIALVVLLVLAVVASAFFLGSIVKQAVETVGPSVTKTAVKLDGATIALVAGSGSIKGLVIGNPEGFKTESAIKVGSINLGLQPRSVFSDKIHVTEVKVESPEITYETGGKGSNLNKLLENVQAAAGGTGGAPAADKSSSKKIQIDDLLITGGKINLSTPFLLGKTATVPLPDIHLTGLGKDSAGLTPAEVTEKVLQALTQGAITAAEKAVLDLTKGAASTVKEAGKTATEGVQKTTKSVTDLFKKK